jgi:hypothetical protein
MKPQSWNKDGIVASKVICDNIIRAEGGKYLTEKDIKDILQSGGDKITDGTNLYADNYDVVGFINGEVEFEDGSSESCDLSELQTSCSDPQQEGMFVLSSIRTFTCDTPKLESGFCMFQRTPLESCTLYADNLTDARKMFKTCNDLSEVIMDFSTIENGDEMFANDTSLKLNNVKFDNLKSGVDMFKNADLNEHNIDIVLNSMKNNNSLETTLDMTIDKSAVRYFFDKTGYLPTDSKNYTDCYIDDIHFRVSPNENIEPTEEFYNGYDYIEYDDTTNEITYYPTEIFNTLEDASGLFSRATLTTPITSFSISMPNVKNTNGMFYANTAITSFTSDLSNVKSAEWMFYGCTALTTFTSTLYSLENGSCMFRETPITTFTAPLRKLVDGTSMFYKCNKMTTFNSDLSTLKVGDSMFSSCSVLATFNPVALTSLESAKSMFYNDSKITSFTYDMPNLKDGYRALYYTYITSFSANLDSLENGEEMFYGCSKMTSFTSELPSLTNGTGMFQSALTLTTFTPKIENLKIGNRMFSGCSTKLASIPNLSMSNLEDGRDMFYSCSALSSLPSTLNLGKLKFGAEMFLGCKLDAASVKRIYDTLPIREQMGNQTYDDASTYRESGDGTLTIGINSAYSSTASTNLSRLNTFATNAGFTSWSNMKEAFANKNWHVFWTYSGTPITFIEV